MRSLPGNSNPRSRNQQDVSVVDLADPQESDPDGADRGFSLR